MTVSQMRDYISNAYPGNKWKQRCRCMSNGQVVAIFFSLQSRDNKTRQVPKDEAGIQLTIFDALKEVSDG